ncbi:CD225/dispanin family protein [Monashia sp. NPDC004114]
MNDDRRDDRSGAPDPSQDSWSAWLPELDPTRDRTQPLDEPAQPPPPPPPPPLPQAPAPVSAPRTRRLPYRALTPAATGRAPAYARRPKSYLGLAILVTIFCFWPFGIVSIIMAATVGSRWSRGDAHGAYRASRAARAWAVAAVVAMLMLFLLFYVVVGTMWSMGRH